MRPAHTQRASWSVFSTAATAATFISASLLVSSYPALSLDPFGKALQEYKKGQYTSALSDFQVSRTSNPNNALVRYYMALCYQGLNQMAQAKGEFDWIASNCRDPKLRSLASQGASNLSGYKRQSVVQSGSTPVIASGVGVASSQVSSKAKVRKILEFKSDTCATCMGFESTFQSTKGNYHDIDFEQYDISDPEAARYNATRTPTLVFLDDRGKVLFQRSGAPIGVQGFSQVINQYR